MVRGKGLIFLGESKSVVDAAAVAGRDACCLCGVSVVGAVGDFDGKSFARGEGERWYLVVFHTMGVVYCVRHGDDCCDDC